MSRLGLSAAELFSSFFEQALIAPHRHMQHGPGVRNYHDRRGCNAAIVPGGGLRERNRRLRRVGRPEVTA